MRGGTVNVALNTDDIGRKLISSVQGVVADLLEVATYTFCADQLTRRGGDTARGMGADWHRRLRFVIPVRDPDKWSSPQIATRLERLVAFMSDDAMRFEFVRETTEPSTTEYLDLGSRSDEVVLFSGGLDSLAGAVDRLAHGDARLLLVSHQSATKIVSRQRDLAQTLGRRFPKRVLHIPVTVRIQGAQPVETTQRTRSLLFGALAAAVAQTSGVSRFNLFENGVVSINLPIAGQVVGAAASRTTHPRVLQDLADFLTTLVGHTMGVENPYLWKTKAEVIEIIRDAGHADLVKDTVSCSRVHEMTRLHTQCGRCSQCLDRRFGTLGAGLGPADPAEMYGVDLLADARDDPLDITMAEAFVRHALELEGLSAAGFMGRFGGEIARIASCVPGMSADAVAGATTELHHRHAANVRRVLERGFRDHAPALAARSLPPSCLLRLVAATPQAVGMTDLVMASAAPTADRRDFSRSSLMRIALDTQSRRIVLEGGQILEGPSTFDLLHLMVQAALDDRAKQRAPENYRFLSAASLTRSLGIAAPSLRRSVFRVRRRVAEIFEEDAGIAISGDALIQNDRWKGYRLNPQVLVLGLDELNSTSGGHKFQPRGSQLVEPQVTRSAA